MEKSNWTPSDKNIEPRVLETITKIHDDIQNLPIHRHKTNVKNAEISSLATLKNDQDIIIKPADKGSATVIMDKVNYIAEGHRQLSNSAHYKKLTGPIYHKTASKIDEIMADLYDKKFI